MKGEERVVSVLKQVLRKELTRINQFSSTPRCARTGGYERLYKTIWDESIDLVQLGLDPIDMFLLVHRMCSTVLAMRHRRFLGRCVSLCEVS
jgi:bacterioferritin (cytochrome b1)